jgi:hypothetical protein
VLGARMAGVEEFAAETAECGVGALGGKVGEDDFERDGFVERPGDAKGCFGGVEVIFRIEKIGVGERA